MVIRTWWGGDLWDNICHLLITGGIAGPGLHAKERQCECYFTATWNKHFKKKRKLKNQGTVLPRPIAIRWEREYPGLVECKDFDWRTSVDTSQPNGTYSFRSVDIEGMST